MTREQYIAHLRKWRKAHPLTEKQKHRLRLYRLTKLLLD